ncbi:MAG: hypothetical protein JWR52_3460 [Marmoricola sp.]|nr:hypothetical protein [Marmoricola sp.]
MGRNLTPHGANGTKDAEATESTPTVAEFRCLMDSGRPTGGDVCATHHRT